VTHDPWWREYLAVPCCGTVPELELETGGDGNRRSGSLQCPRCGRIYPLEDGIVRFAETSGYAEAFGVEWEQFGSTQIDHLNATTISEDRLALISGGSLEFLHGRTVFDFGCGAGRYAAVAARHGARVVAADIALGAIRSCRRNTSGIGDVICVHANPVRPAVQSGSADVVISIGVYEHTPSPPHYLREAAAAVRRGGRLVLWGYERRLKSALAPKWLLRPVTRRMRPDRLMRVVRHAAPSLLAVSDALLNLPKGRYWARLVPVANHRGRLPLSDEQRLEWATLDTFDWLAPTYVRPMRYSAVATLLEGLGFAVVRTDPDAVGCVATRVASESRREPATERAGGRA